MRIVAFDTETDSLNAYKAKLQIVSWCGLDLSPRVSRVRDWKIHGELGCLEEAFVMLEDASVLKVFHNAKYDLRVLHNYGIKVRPPIADTMIMSQLVSPFKQHGLKFLTERILHEDYGEEIRLLRWERKNKRHRSFAPDRLLLPYAKKDALCTMRLFVHFVKQLETHDMLEVFEQEMELMTKCVLPMESYGIRLDVPECRKQLVECRNRSAKLIQRMRNYVCDKKFNPRSSRQIICYIFPSSLNEKHEEAHDRIWKVAKRRLKTAKPERYTAKGQISTDAIALRRSRTKLGKMIIAYRKLEKTIKTYLLNFLKMRDDNDIIHTSFNQTGALTGRFSSSNPNLQNIPKRGASSLANVRRCFRARPKRVLVFIDYDQIEIRLAAHASGQQYMLDIINDGGDLHDVSVLNYYGIGDESPQFQKYREAAKRQNYAMLYRCGPARLQGIFYDELGLDVSLSKCQEYVRRYWEINNRILDLQHNLEEEVLAWGGIRNPYNRWVRVPKDETYKAINYLIQSTAGDIIKQAMPKCQSILRGRQSRMVLQVHDELIFDMVPEERFLIPDLVQAMEVLGKFDVPITCSASYGLNWKDKKNLNWKKFVDIPRESPTLVRKSPAT